MSTLRQPRLRLTAAVLALAAMAGTPAGAADALKSPNLGTPLSADDITKWDLTIFPDGRGLPPGQGTAAEGKPLFEANCARCHGEAGRGATAEELVGPPKPPSAENASKAIGSYWPYATTIYDFVRRSMPAHAPGSLSSDEVYAITAYLLQANGVTAETDVIDAKTLPKVVMPNRNGFVWVDVPAQK